MLTSIISFFKSFSFLKGILRTIAALIPLGLGYAFGVLEMDLPIALSVVAISPSNIPGNQQRPYGGLLAATLLAAASSVLVNLTAPYWYPLLPTMFVLTFGNAYISLYRHRATMVPSTGLFEIVSTLAHLQTGWNIALYSDCILFGGPWYSGLVYIFLKVHPRLYSEQLLGKCFVLTANFFSIRADLSISEDRTDGFKRLINLQASLNENYEKLREAILSSRSKSSKTDYLQQQLLMFMELVDIFELALADPVQYGEVGILFAQYKADLEKYVTFLKELVEELKRMLKYIGSRKQIRFSNRLRELLLRTRETNEVLRKRTETSEEDRERSLMLRNFYVYIENQYHSAENIRLIFENYCNSDAGTRDENTYRRFVSYQNYSWRRLKDHIPLQSTFFRHAMRLSVMVVLGYSAGEVFTINNVY